MKEIVEKKWGELSSIWNKLYENNTTATPFQSYEFLTFTGKGKARWNDLFRLFGLQELNIVLYKDNEAVAIAPLLVKKAHGKNVIYLRGHFTTANQLDFIYRSWQYEDLKFLMDGIRSMVDNASFYLDRISEKTITGQYLKKYFPAEKTETQVCFSIPIPASYDEWYGSLRKSVRRKLTSHTNRMIRDEVELTSEFIINKHVDNATCRRMMDVYADRFIIKNNFVKGPLAKPTKRILMLYLLRDKVTRWLKKVENNFFAIIYMNNEIAAFTCGVICKDKRIILSRLAMLTKFARYSPGGMLISTAIKYITEQNANGSLDVDQLDLSQGSTGGMCYKQAYGGLPHDCYTFVD